MGAEAQGLATAEGTGVGPTAIQEDTFGALHGRTVRTRRGLGEPQERRFSNLPFRKCKPCEQQLASDPATLADAGAGYAFALWRGLAARGSPSERRSGPAGYWDKARHTPADGHEGRPERIASVWRTPFPEVFLCRLCGTAGMQWTATASSVVAKGHCRECAGCGLFRPDTGTPCPVCKQKRRQRLGVCRRIF